MSKKEYQAVVEACTNLATVASIQNKLNKIAIKTEDNQLKSLLAVAIAHLERAHLNATQKQRTQKTAFPRTKEPAKSLLIYCYSVIKSQEPQWQIIARKNGWVAPDK